jgi:hypothetical protein
MARNRDAKAILHNDKKLLTSYHKNMQSLNVIQCILERTVFNHLRKQLQYKCMADTEETIFDEKT